MAEGGVDADVDDVVVVLRCEACGELIELRRLEKGAELANVTAFLRQHDECLRRLPRQRLSRA